MNYEIGQIVNHQTFGEGTIVDVLERTTSFGVKDASIITVDFSWAKREFTEYSLQEFTV